jgi:hypothetical protein
MDGAALDERGLAEHLAHGPIQRLGAVDHTSRPLVASKPRSTRSANKWVTTVSFSVSPSHSPTGSLSHQR